MLSDFTLEFNKLNFDERFSFITTFVRIVSQFSEINQVQLTKSLVGRSGTTGGPQEETQKYLY